MQDAPQIDLQAIARTYRADHNIQSQSGAVVIFEDKAHGWIADLSCPQGWQPGCIAFTADNLIYKATGGNQYDGASEWTLLTAPAANATKAKTTLTDLLAADSNQVNPLLANSTDDTIDFGATPTPPPVGTYWEQEGGIFIGTMLDGENRYHIIMANKAFEGEWGQYGTEIEGDFSYSNGQHNTQLILTAEPQNPLLLEITQHTADGHSDFYLPANFENNLICANAQKHVEKTWHWSSTQFSAYSAWVQDFEHGSQDITSKNCRYAARAVRRILIIE